ncbi:hypothetical protein KC951_01525 [Candidatus Saccharibacteria bacterium]|nr:hypothetical protein [Candidatus Saccharibacteria bacterium]
MKPVDQKGAINVLLIPLIVIVLAFFGALAFGFWAYSGRQDYKNNVDEKIATAVDVAEKQTATEKDNEFIEREKQPLKEYQGPSSLGTIIIKYPKTWSAYVNDSGKGSAPLDGYFYPGVVPGVDTGASYALRLQVSEKTFSDEAKAYDNDVKQGKVSSQPYQPVNVKNVVGLRLTGEIEKGKQGIMILLPLRDKTIKLWTEAPQFEQDFDTNILPNFSFTP